MTAIHQLNPTIDVHCPKGYGKAISWIDGGSEINTIWKIVLYKTGKVINVFDDEILVYPNLMTGGEQLKIPDNWIK